MSDPFYRAFEERYYAPRQTIRRMREQYLPFVAPLKSLYPGANTFDLGCGRGEWLELMLEAGFTAFGVDLDEGMLEGCRALNLPAAQGDAVEYLARLPDDSHVVISAFHVVEHISFQQLRTVVQEALRVLKPGGLLIMETPNSENVVVGTSNFYLDPTHQRPIPSKLLSFLTEYEGFARTKVLHLQESPTLLQQQVLSLHDVLNGVSPDYAVVAQKDALSSTIKAFDDAFSRNYGLSLQELSRCYELGIRGPIQRLNAEQQRTSTELERLDALLQQYVHHNLHQVALDVQNLHQSVRVLSAQQSALAQVQEEGTQRRLQQAELRAQQAEQSAAAAQATLESVYASTSWRLLAPFRWVAIQLRLLTTQGPRRRLHALGKKMRGASEAGSPTQTTQASLTHAPQEDRPQSAGTPADARPVETSLLPLSARTQAIHDAIEQAARASNGKS